MVIGARKTEVGAAYRSGHRLGNALLTLLIGILARLCGRSFNDIPSDYRVFSRCVVKSFPVLSLGFRDRNRDQRSCARVEDTGRGRGHKIQRASRRARIEASDPLGRPLHPEHDGELVSHGAARSVFRRNRGVLALAAIILAVPLTITYAQTGLVPCAPTAILSTELMLPASLNLFAGLILDTVFRGRRELRRLAYLGFSVPRPGSSHQAS